MSHDNNEDRRSIRDDDTGGYSAEEIQRRLYTMEREALHCSTRIESRLMLVERQLSDQDRWVRESMDNILERLKELVTKARFQPVELIAYGLVGGVGLTVLGAVLNRVLIR